MRDPDPAPSKSFPPTFPPSDEMRCHAFHGCNRAVSLLTTYRLRRGIGIPPRVAVAQTPTIDFDRDIRPILSDKCFVCHGPDEQHREAGLRLDRKSGVFGDLGGYRAVVPGNPDESELLRRVEAEDQSERMPPVDTKLAITPMEAAKLRAWIA